MKTTGKQEHARMAYLLPSYVTGEYDDERVRHHLRHCARCRKLAAQYRTAFDAIGLIVPMNEPPSELRTRILDDLPQQPPFPLPSSVRFILDHPKTVIAASFAVLFLLVGSIYVNFSGLPGAVAPLKTAQAQKAAVKLDPTKNADGILTVLSGTAAAPHARAIIAVGANGTTAVLYAFGLPEPPQGHVYQLWLMKGRTHRNGGILQVTPEGHAVHFIQTPGPISEFVHFGITLEPASGSPVPTGSKILENESQEVGQQNDDGTGNLQAEPTSIYGIVPE